jgi:hypothetical protein
MAMVVKNPAVSHFWGEFEKLSPRTPSSQRFCALITPDFLCVLCGLCGNFLPDEKYLPHPESHPLRL